MYDDLIKRLRETSIDFGELDDVSVMLLEAANAIEELSNSGSIYGKAWTLGYDAGRDENKPQWIKIESRPMTEEERKEWSENIGYDIEYENAIIYTSKLPDDGEEALVCNKYGHIWLDTFDNDPDYGVGFETNGDMDGIVAWMPKPKPYEPPKEE